MPDTDADPVLFTQTGCAECARVRSWLGEHDVGFIEWDAGADANAAEALAATGMFATPLLVVGRETVLGFRPEALAAALQTLGGGAS